MPDWSQVSRAHVLQAMSEWDQIGDREFLRRYGYRRTVTATLWHQGQEYDSAAIVGAAHLNATGAAPSTTDIRGGSGAARVLADLGFDVVVDEEEAEKEERKLEARAQRARTPGTRATGTRASSTRSTTSASSSTAKPRTSSSSRTTATSTRRKAAEPPAPKICPTCYMALPASGVCDFCD